MNRERKMSEGLIKKYVKNIGELLKDMSEWAREPSAEPIYHDYLILTFGRLFRHFNFKDITFGPRGGLDAAAELMDGPKWVCIQIEQECQRSLNHFLD